MIANQIIESEVPLQGLEMEAAHSSTSLPWVAGCIDTSRHFTPVGNAKNYSDWLTKSY